MDIMLSTDRNKPASSVFLPIINSYHSPNYLPFRRKERSLPSVIMPMRSSGRILVFSRKNVLTWILVIFMFYVVICLQELRQNVQSILEPYSASDLILQPSTLSRLSRTDEAYRLVLRNGQSARERDADGLERAKSFTSADLHHLHDKSTATQPNMDNKAALQLDDVHLSVKTSKKFHRQRLDTILQTWYKAAKNQVAVSYFHSLLAGLMHPVRAGKKKQTYFITDEEDGEFALKSGGHLVISTCSNSHHRKALCCKMAMELDFFFSQNKKWFCHFDDDNYVNVQNLVDLLNGYDSAGSWYLGKPSIKAPIELPHLKSSTEDENAAFWFATGGAGFCLSHGLLERMKPLIARGKFMTIGEKIRLPDDVTIGYIVEHLLKIPLTMVDRFHSHLEPLYIMDVDTLRNQISFSYSTYRGNQMNRVSVSGWDNEVDPTRFLSLDCLLRQHKDTADCPTTAVSV